MFIVQPENTTAFQGDSVTFSCDAGISIRPHWIIDGDLYNWRGLRQLGLIAGNFHLIVPNITVQYNGSNFQCVYITDTLRNSSQVATLTVLQGNDYIATNSYCYSFTFRVCSWANHHLGVHKKYHMLQYIFTSWSWSWCLFCQSHSTHTEYARSFQHNREWLLKLHTWRPRARDKRHHIN